MTTGQSVPRQAVRSGLILAGLFGWLLSFPMFGPLLFATAGSAAPKAGLVFVFAHGTGLLLLHWLPNTGPVRRRLLPGAGALAAALTLTLGLWPVSEAVRFGTMALIGLAAAVLVLGWTDTWIACGDRLAALAVAMAGANLVLAVISLPAGLPSELWLLITAALALVSGFAMVTPSPSQLATEPETWLMPQALPGATISTAAFAVADYFVGGIWYNLVATSAPTARAGQPSLEAALYAAAILVFFWIGRRRQGGQLALYSLSALGIGLVAAATGIAGLPMRAILLLGMAAGDLFFWDQLGRLGLAYGSRRSLGIGLGASVLLIGLANLGAGLAPTGESGPGSLFLLVGAGLLFLVIPLVFRYATGSEGVAFLGQAPAGDPAAGSVAGLPVQTGPAEGLTPTEHQVYLLLVEGATDQEIAARLFISRHTVKFHVRNVLRKVGAANRKQLLSRLVAASEQKRRP